MFICVFSKLTRRAVQRDPTVTPIVSLTRSASAQVDIISPSTKIIIIAWFSWIIYLPIMIFIPKTKLMIRKIRNFQYYSMRRYIFNRSCIRNDFRYKEIIYTKAHIKLYKIYIWTNTRKHKILIHMHIYIWIEVVQNIYLHQLDRAHRFNVKINGFIYDYCSYSILPNYLKYYICKYTLLMNK